MKVNGKDIDLNPQEIMQELVEFRSKLGKLNSDIIKLGNAKSQAEYDYRLLKAKKIMILRADKTPVTIIADLVKGDPDVAALKLQLDAQEVLYDNKRENIRSLRDVMSVYQSILNYLKAEIGGYNKTEY